VGTFAWRVTHIRIAWRRPAASQQQPQHGEGGTASFLTAKHSREDNKREQDNRKRRYTCEQYNGQTVSRDIRANSNASRCSQCPAKAA